MSLAATEVHPIDMTGKPTLILRNSAGYRYRARIINVGPIAIYLGLDGVVPQSGYRLAPGDDVDVSAGEEMWACTNGGTFTADAKPATLAVIVETHRDPAESTPVAIVGG